MNVRWLLFSLFFVLAGCYALAGESAGVSDYLVAAKSQDWMTLFFYAVVTVWTIFGGAKRLDEWRKSQVLVAQTAEDIKSKTYAALKVKLVDIARGSCAEVYEEYYRDVKQKAADGKITVEEKSELKKKARNMAVEKMLTYGKSHGLDLIKEFGTPVLKAAAEEAVSWLKSKAKVSSS